MIKLLSPACLVGLYCAPMAYAQQAPEAKEETLEPVVVTAQKQWVENLIDRKVYNVASDVQTSLGSASDLLNAIPSVDVDGDGVVSLRGDTNVLILIDGKPSALFSGASAGDNLQALPASDIERVEVITNPPAQYKAEGVAGIINIVTRKRRPAGESGSIQANGGTEGRYQLGANASYVASALTVTASAVYRHDLRERLQDSDLIGAQNPGGPVLDSKSAISEVIHRASPPLKLSIDYALDARDAVHAQFTRTGRAGIRDYIELNDTLLPGGQITQSQLRLSDGHDGEVDYDESLGYERKLGRDGESLSVSVHRTTSRNNEHYSYTNDPLMPPASVFYDNLVFREDDATSEADVDYTLPIAPMQTLKLGYHFEQDAYGYSATGASIDPLSGVQTPEAGLTDVFDYLQDINALYASYDWTVGRWSYRAGLRGETTRTDGRQLTQAITTAYNYTRLFPSLHVERQIDERSTVSLGASRRITRPDPSNLNPYIDYEYTPNLRAGNANLRPQYTDSFELGYTYDTSGSTYSMDGYYRRNTDSVTDITENLGNGLALSTKTNLPLSDAAGVEFTVSAHPLRSLSLTLSGNAFYNQIDAEALGFAGIRSTTGLNGKLKLAYQPTRADTAELVATRTDKQLTPQGEIDAINIVNLGYRHGFSSSLKASIWISDLFEGQHLHRVAVTPTFTDTYQRTVVGRVIWFGLAYTFGRTSHEQPAKFDYDQ